MDIDLKKCGQCGSCDYCVSIEPESAEAQTAYIRKCRKFGREYEDRCQAYCPDYIWDGKSEEVWKTANTAPLSDSAPGENHTPGKNGSVGWYILLLALIVVAAAIYLVPRYLPEEADVPVRDTATTLSQESVPTVENENDAPVREESVATESTTGQLMVKTNDGNGLNLREKPDAKSKVIGGMRDGSVVTVQKTEGNWGYVTYNGKSGWCSTDYLVPVGDAADGINRPAIVATQKDPLRLRAEAGTKAAVIASIPKGAQVTVIRQSGDWSYVKYKEQYGWCSTEFLKMQ